MTQQVAGVRQPVLRRVACPQDLRERDRRSFSDAIRPGRNRAIHGPRDGELQGRTDAKESFVVRRAAGSGLEPLQSYRVAVELTREGQFTGAIRALALEGEGVALHAAFQNLEIAGIRRAGTDEAEQPWTVHSEHRRPRSSRRSGLRPPQSYETCGTILRGQRFRRAPATPMREPGFSAEHGIPTPLGSARATTETPLCGARRDSSVDDGVRGGRCVARAGAFERRGRLVPRRDGRGRIDALAGPEVDGRPVMRGGVGHLPGASPSDGAD